MVSLLFTISSKNNSYMYISLAGESNGLTAYHVQGSPWNMPARNTLAKCMSAAPRPCFDVSKKLQEKDRCTVGDGRLNWIILLGMYMYV